MINTWWSNIILYLFLHTVMTQCYKLATKKSKNDGALTVLILFLSGVFTLFYIPFFEMKFSSNPLTYICLGIACIFYAISDRTNATARRGLEVSTFSILYQFSTVFIFTWGILFFKEPLVAKKVAGALIILIVNIAILYRKGKFVLNKYVVFSMIGNLATSIAISVDVGISKQFNLALYVAITFMIPPILIFLMERIQLSTIVNEFKEGNKKAILIVSMIWGITIISMLRAYQFGSVTTIAPLCSLTAILNVFASYFTLKEKDCMLKKVVLSNLVILGIMLIKVG